MKKFVVLMVLFVMSMHGCFIAEPSGGGNVNSSCEGGHGGETSTASEVECNVMSDCYDYGNVCVQSDCVDNKCVVGFLTPEYSCGDHDYRCVMGACCYTCIVDTGVTLGEIDYTDGPCKSGNEDHFCGKSGTLCEDCTLKGGICVSGKCITAM